MLGLAFYVQSILIVLSVFITQITRIFSPASTALPLQAIRYRLSHNAHILWSSAVAKWKENSECLPERGVTCSQY